MEKFKALQGVEKYKTILLFSTLFTSSIVAFRTPFEAYFAYFVFALFVPGFISKFGIPNQIFAIFVPVLITGLFHVLVGNNTTGNFIKIFVGVFSSYVFYYFLIRHFNMNIKLLCRYYVKGAYVVSIIGIFQVISYNIGFRSGYNYGYILNKWGANPGGLLGLRMNSVFPEPSNFAAIIAPAFFISVFFLFFKKGDFITKRESIVIFIAYLLTFSSLGYIGIFIMLILLLINYGVLRYFLIIVPVFYLAFTLLYANVSEFKHRIDGVYKAFAKNEYKHGVLHGSSFVLYNNYHVAIENFSHHPLFGTGLGSHPVAFDKYSLTNQAGVLDITFNKADANSMFLRLLSETGLFGASLFLFIVFKFYVSKGKAIDDEDWIISNSLLIVILLYLLRQGHYFIHGFPFFVWGYYLNYLSFNAKKKKLEEQQ